MDFIFATKIVCITRLYKAYINASVALTCTVRKNGMNFLNLSSYVLVAGCKMTYKRDWEKAIPGQDGVAMRKCLGPNCGKDFMSSWVGNRICGPCSLKIERMSGSMEEAHVSQTKKGSSASE